MVMRSSALALTFAICDKALFCDGRDQLGCVKLFRVPLIDWASARNVRSANLGEMPIIHSKLPTPSFGRAHLSLAFHVDDVPARQMVKERPPQRREGGDCEGKNPARRRREREGERLKHVDLLH